jgi:transcriptional regulator GlxA family with amidase domain
VLYVDHGQLPTSAGATAGTDLCLHLIRKDHGAAVAAESARLAVAPLERAGGQAQFIRQVAPVAHGLLQPVQEWITRNLANRLVAHPYTLRGLVCATLGFVQQRPDGSRLL